MKTLATLLTLTMLISGCAKKDKPSELSLKTLEGKRIAIAEIRAEKEVRDIIEIAIVNEVIENGRFVVVSREVVREALVEYPAYGDRYKLGKKLGADFVLDIDVLDAKITDDIGLKKVYEEDSVLKEEWHESDAVVAKKYVKVKGQNGVVRLKFKFTDIANDGNVLSASGIAEQSVDSINNPNVRKLQFLEKLSTIAVQDFFEKLPK